MTSARIVSKRPSVAVKGWSGHSLAARMVYSLAGGVAGSFESLLAADAGSVDAMVALGKSKRSLVQVDEALLLQPSPSSLPARHLTLSLKMDSSSSQTVAAHAMNDRIPLPADTNVVPPRYRPIIIREWASRFPTYYAEFEELHWTFDGWDALADELHADWLYYITAATRVRAKIDELWKGKTTFASSAERTRYKKWLYEESDRLYEEGGRLEERLQGPGGKSSIVSLHTVLTGRPVAGLGLLRRRFLKLHQELDRGSRLSGLPSLSGKSLLASAVAAAKTLASKIASE